MIATECADDVLLVFCLHHFTEIFCRLLCGVTHSCPSLKVSNTLLILCDMTALKLIALVLHILHVLGYSAILLI